MNDYIETGIAVVLVFFVFSTVVYTIQELIAANLQYRGKMLKSSLEQLLNSGVDKLAMDLLAHPQVKMLQEAADKLPSYVPATNFAMAIMDIVAQKNTDPRSKDLLADFKTGLARFQDTEGELATLLKTLAENSTDTDSLRGNIEKWFNAYMDRVTGWYKKKHLWVTRTIALAVAIAFHLDMISVTETIYGDPVLKATLVAQAERMTDKPDAVKAYYTYSIESDIKAIDQTYDDKRTKDSLLKTNNAPAIEKSRDSAKNALIAGYNQKQYETAKALIDSVSGGKLVFGWEHLPWEIADAKTHTVRPTSAPEFFLMLLGLLIGAAGISMGAPFWFELMTKLVNVRRAGIKPKAKKN